MVFLVLILFFNKTKLLPFSFHFFILLVGKFDETLSVFITFSPSFLKYIFTSTEFKKYYQQISNISMQ